MSAGGDPGTGIQVQASRYRQAITLMSRKTALERGRPPPNCVTELFIHPAYIIVCPEHTRTWNLINNKPQVLRFAGKLASGGAVCGSEAVLHPFWQNKVDLQTCTNRPSFRTQAVLGSHIHAALSDFAGGLWGSVLVGGTHQDRRATDAGNDAALQLLHPMAT
eukprot:scaffold93986_cov19-Tisochrysis_lutea.AAC.1